MHSGLLLRRALAPHATSRALSSAAGRRDVHAQVLRGAPTAASDGITAASVVRETPLVFDTHRVVVALENAGFQRSQAAAVAEALVAVSSAAQQHASHNGVVRFPSARAHMMERS